MTTPPARPNKYKINRGISYPPPPIHLGLVVTSNYDIYNIEDRYLTVGVIYPTAKKVP